MTGTLAGQSPTRGIGCHTPRSGSLQASRLQNDRALRSGCLLKLLVDRLGLALLDRGLFRLLALRLELEALGKSFAKSPGVGC